MNAERRNSEQRLGTARATLTPEAEPHTLILDGNLGGKGRRRQGRLFMDSNPSLPRQEMKPGEKKRVRIRPVVSNYQSILKPHMFLKRNPTGGGFLVYSQLKKARRPVQLRSTIVATNVDGNVVIRSATPARTGTKPGDHHDRGLSMSSRLVMQPFVPLQSLQSCKSKLEYYSIHRISNVNTEWRVD